MPHRERYEELLELEISSEPVLKKKNYLKNQLATSSFEIVLIFFYIKYDYPIQNSKVVQVKHLDEVTARAGNTDVLFI